MLLVYTGNGKGKTTACVGQAMRALGQGMRVGFAQCMKRDAEAGEQHILRSLLGEFFYAGGLGFFRQDALTSEHREAALHTLDWAKAHMPQLDLLVLDECLYALRAKLITQEELLQVVESAEEDATHLVLSGRDAPPWLVEKAHLVTEMQEVKHPWQQGIYASKGIEF